MDEALFDETRQLFHALENWAESRHADLDVTTAMRAVLELLFREGPTTVPHAARIRMVSRQHIQQQVYLLLTRKLVRRNPNPVHKRSPLVSLTDRGRALIENIRADERQALSQLRAGVSDHAMREATHVLAAWKKALVEGTRRGNR